MNNKQESLWDWICSQIGFDKKGKEIQGAIKKFLKAQKFALEKEHSWIAGRLLRKELKAKDKEFIEILDELKVKINEDWSATATAENMEVFRKLINKIKQIKQKYERT